MPSLAEAISCLQKASSCKGCGRLPSSSKEDRAHGDEDGHQKEYYDAGALLVSSQCGDMFCAACWEKSMPTCPICQSESATSPRPIIASLAADSKANAFKNIDISDVSKNGMYTVDELSSLVGILNNITSTTALRTRAAHKLDNNSGHKDDDDDEVPGTLLDLYPQACEQSLNSETPTILGSHVTSTTNSMVKRQYTPLTGKKSEASETPTVRESQVKSIDTSQVNEETQACPGTLFTPLHKSYSKKNNTNAQLNYFIDNIAKVGSPMAPSTASKSKHDLPSSSDESEVEGTCLSQFKLKCRDKVDQHDDVSSESEVEFQTEPWERQLDFTKIDNPDEKPEPVAKRRCVSTSPNETARILVQRESDMVQLLAREKQLYLAYDVLNKEECEALSYLCNGKGVRVMSDMISISKGGNTMTPLPTILVTHAIEKPRFANSELTRYNSVATCHRTFSYLKAMALGARCIDAQWLKDCQKSGTLISCDAYSIWSDLESYNTMIASGSRIEGDTIRGSHPFDKTLKLDGAVFGFIDTQTANAKLLGFTSLTSVQISSLVECWGGSVSNASFTMMHAIMTRDCATLNEVIPKLKTYLQENRDVSESWSIEPFDDEELEALINDDGTLRQTYSDDYRIPIIGTKWLENSICWNSLQSLKEYCIGVLCFEFNMGSNVDERQTLMC